MQVLLNAKDMHVLTTRDLHQCFESVRQRQFNELWLNAEEDGPSLCMLVNGTSAWLMYLPAQDDASSHSLNPLYQGSAEQRMAFQLSNGQMDEYPSAWVLLLEDALAACDYFVDTQGGRSPIIMWEDA